MGEQTTQKFDNSGQETKNMKYFLTISPLHLFRQSLRILSIVQFWYTGMRFVPDHLLIAKVVGTPFMPCILSQR
jgi:hypothetical protein